MSGRAPVVAFFCATYLKPEMHHIHRQILAVDGWTPLVLAQKIEQRETFPVPDLEVIPRSPWRFLARAIERKVTHAPWQISRGEAARMHAVLSDRGAKVLHVFFGNVAVHLLPLLERVDLPVVVSFHGADVTGAIATPAYRAAREGVFARAARVACRSEALVEQVRGLGCPQEKLCVVRTVLPDLPFQERTLPEDGALRLVQACRLIPKKGVATSLEAFGRLAGHYPRMTFTIAGAGPLENELRNRTDQLGLSERVQFTGFLGQAALRDLFSTAHVFLHPSETVGGDTEGIPNGLIEAMAMGLPVVTTRHGGIPEAVEDRVSGLLCEENDAQGLAAAIESLISDSAFYTRIASGGADAARAKFSRQTTGRVLRVLYDEVSGRAGQQLPD